MSSLPTLSNLSGKWHGKNLLWLSPDEPVRESEADAEISTIAQGQFTEIMYTWVFEGKAQEGRIILGQTPDSKAVKAVWFDTWHMMEQFMVCEGEVDDEGVVWVKGSYAAPPGPDWGWQISIETQKIDVFHLIMHNITPEGEAFLAVDISCSPGN